MLLDEVGSLESIAGILYVARLAHPDGSLEQRLHHRLGAVDVVDNGGIDFFPKARHTAHAVGAYLLDGTLYVLGVVVDSHYQAMNKAEHCPAQLEDVAQGQEAERHVVVVNIGQPHAVSQHRGAKVAVSEHHALGLAGGA